jgi:NAD(P)-dependent dehydrogenase (short-subunit alcohol dehydrogenase family)
VTGKVVLITGAGRACGRALAEDLAARGAAVVVNDIDADGGRQTVQRIEAAGGAATFVQADVSVDAEVEALVDRCLELHGRLDGAVNNAGVELPVAVADSDAPSFARVLATNLEGVRACLKHEIRAMRRTGGGAIVNMSSVTSDLTAAPLNGLYGASKGGVDALTKAAAVEVAMEGISINALAFLGADVENGMFQRSSPTPASRRSRSSQRSRSAGSWRPPSSAPPSASCSPMRRASSSAPRSSSTGASPRPRPSPTDGATRRQRLSEPTEPRRRWLRPTTGRPGSRSPCRRGRGLRRPS